jgi:hypothetical protein
LKRQGEAGKISVSRRQGRRKFEAVTRGCLAISGAFRSDEAFLEFFRAGWQRFSLPN